MRACICSVVGPIVATAVRDGLSKVGPIDNDSGEEHLGIKFEHVTPEGKRFEVVAWIEYLHVTCKEKELDG